jgi:hypothetical protein
LPEAADELSRIEPAWYDTGKEPAMSEASEEQWQETTEPEPATIDPYTLETYVLVRQDASKQIKSLLTMDEYDPDEGMAHISGVMVEDDANDPLLESYQHYGKQPD